MATEVIMPSLGESVFEGTIISWLKDEGDDVARYEPLLEIETDKITTEATAEVSGTLLKILAPEGETVKVGSVLAYIGEANEDLSDAAMVTKEQTGTDEVKVESVAVESFRPPTLQQPTNNGPSQSIPERYTGRISPVVGRIAEEHDINLDNVPGTGRDGRITKNDILSYIDQVKSDTTQVQHGDMEAAPVIQSTESLGVVPGEILKLSTMRRSIAEHMVRSKRTSPHVTTVFRVDFTKVSQHRQEKKAGFARDGVKLTYTAYVIAAIAQAIRTHPIVNSMWTDEGILLKKEVNIGVAAAVSEGLIVPVIKNADGMNLLGLARTINSLTDLARRGKLQPDDVQGGTFTLTNHGTSGSLFATPIINQPQCAILGLGKLEKGVKVIDDAIAIRIMAYASLTFDHRILDGATADNFMTTFKNIIEKWH